MSLCVLAVITEPNIFVVHTRYPRTVGFVVSLTKYNNIDLSEVLAEVDDVK